MVPWDDENRAVSASRNLRDFADFQPLHAVVPERVANQHEFYVFAAGQVDHLTRRFQTRGPYAHTLVAEHSGGAEG